MKQSLAITQYILRMLSESQSLMNLVPYSRIYPIDAKQGTTFPFIVIHRNNIDAANSKDGIYEDSVSVSITVVADRYDKSVAVASEVRNALERKKYQDDDVYISSIYLTSATESMYNNAYIQQLQFSFKVQ